jgi:hypothetical protein
MSRIEVNGVVLLFQFHDRSPSNQGGAARSPVLCTRAYRTMYEFAITRSTMFLRRARSSLLQQRIAAETTHASLLLPGSAGCPAAPR